MEKPGWLSSAVAYNLARRVLVPLAVLIVTFGYGQCQRCVLCMEFGVLCTKFGVSFQLEAGGHAPG